MLNPDLNDYQLTSIITECCGGVAVVYSAQYKPTDKNVAIKRYFVDKCKEKANLIQVTIKCQQCQYALQMLQHRCCVGTVRFLFSHKFPISFSCMQKFHQVLKFVPNYLYMNEYQTFVFISSK